MTHARPTPEIDARILGEAADWLVLLQSGEAADTDHARLTQWRQRSAAHEAAWQRAETMLATFRSVPSRLARDTLQGVGGAARRRLLRSFALAAIAAPSAWVAWRQLPWREWRADLRTAAGEQQVTSLADGTRLTLNTDTAVNVDFSAAQRLVQLVSGEILIVTAPDIAPHARPFVVQTADGQLRPLGTRFAVRRLEDHTMVVVTEGAVEATARCTAQRAIVRAGEQLRLTSHEAFAPEAAAAGTTSWERGMLLARDMRVGELAAELRRYHRGVLRCDPAIAGLAVSGAFPVTDVTASLALLEKTLPVRVERISNFWITLRPR